MNPLQCHHLVEYAVVAREFLFRLLGQFGMGHKAESAQSVFNATIDDALSNKALLCATVRAGEESSTVNHDKNRQFLVLVLGWCLHAQVETVLAHAQVSPVLVGVDGLWRPVAPSVGLINAFPWLLFYGSFPSQVADRRFCVGYVFVEGKAFVLYSFNLSLLHRGGEQLCVQAHCAEKRQGCHCQKFLHC